MNENGADWWISKFAERFGMSLGNVDYDSMEDSAEKNQFKDYPVIYSAIFVYFILFTFLVLIVGTNFLTSINVGDTIDIVKESKVYAYKGQADLIYYLEGILPCKSFESRLLTSS